MVTINKWFDMDFTIEELSKESRLYFNDTKMNSERILKCLKIALKQEMKISIKNLSVYRLDSLIKIITVKKISLEHLNKNGVSKNSIEELEPQLKNYTKEAILLIKEIIKTGRINHKLSHDINTNVLDVENESFQKLGNCG